MKKNTMTFAVCIVFAAVLTGISAFAAKGTSNVILRDSLGYIYAAIALAAIIWLYVTGKKRVNAEPGRFAMVPLEYFFLGAAVLIVSISSLIEIFPQFNKYLFSFNATTEGPFLITRMVFCCLGFIVGPLLLAAGRIKKPALKQLASSFAAVWSFAYLITECTFFIPLPDISLYLPRLFTATFTTLAFCYLTMAGKVGLRQNAAGLRTSGGMLVMVSISDMVLWILYHNNVYREMLLSSFLFAALFGLFFIRLSLTLDQKFKIAAEVSDDEI